MPFIEIIRERRGEPARGRFIREDVKAPPRGRRPLIVGRQGDWAPDPTMEADSFHRPPRRLAPAPPQRTVLEDPGCGRRQVCYHIKKIGEGGQGRCDVFERKADGKLFVYKLMKTPVDVDSRNKPVEAKILQDILGPHPRIIQMYNFGGGPQTVFYLEYCAAGDLAGVIENYHDKHGALIPEGFLWHTYLQLAEALAFMHEGFDLRNDDGRPPRDWQAIVHRDIKPSNIFLRKPRSKSEYPDVVLADFGLATRSLYTCQGRDDFMGTMAYQGPEIPLHSRAGDRWAIGACIHDMGVGSPPIKRVPHGEDARTWVYRQDARKVIKLRTKGYSPQLDDALSLVLRTSPWDRDRGRELIVGIEECMLKWNGDWVQLSSWALPR